MRKCKLGDLFQLKQGFAFKSEKYVSESQYAIVTLANISELNNFQYNLSEMRYYEGAFPESVILKDRDLILPMTEQVEGLFGNSAFVPKDDKVTFVLNQRVGLVKTYLESDRYYLHYLLALNSVRQQLEYRATGTRQRNISPKGIYDVNVEVPEPEERERIGSLLYTLEQKTNNNNVIIQQLESMAKTLYDYWFVQFDFPDANGRPYKASGGEMVWNEDLGREIPEGWKSGIVSDLGDIVAGGTPSTQKAEYFSTDGVAWITPKDMSLLEGKYVFHGAMDISEDGLKNSSAKLMPAGSVLYTTRAPIGYVAVAGNSVCTNQGFKSVIPKENVGTEFVYYTLKSLEVHFKNVGNGSTFSEVSKEIFSSVPVCIPNNILLKKFNAIVAGYSMKQKNVQLENEQIISLRDFLLPMLMNGQVIFKS